MLHRQQVGASRRRRGVRGVSAPAVVPNPFPDAIGLWYVDTYESSPRPRIANANAVTAAMSDLLGAPRRFFTQRWQGSSTTIVDSAATAPDGTTSASTVVGTAFWFLRAERADTLPAGTYTIAVNAKRNTGTDQTFCLYANNTSTLSPTKTATSSWQRFSFTFTIGAPSVTNFVGLTGQSGSGASNLQICDLEMYSGSSDLGPQTYAGHMRIGATAYDTRPVYASGALDLSAQGWGMLQFPTAQALTTFTVQALVSKVGAGAGGGNSYSTLLSKAVDATSYLNFTVFSEINTVPEVYLDGATQIAPTQGTGFFRATGQGYHVVTARYDGTNTEYWIDDVRMLRKAGTLGPWSIEGFYVNIANNQTFYGGNSFAGALALWNRALTDAEIAGAVTRQHQRAALSGITSAITTRVVAAEGDSITANASSYADQFAPNASPVMYGNKRAIGGSTSADMIARATALDAILPTVRTGRKFILSVLIGANDGLTGGGFNQATWLANLAAYLDARRTAGWLVCLCTITPRADAGFATFNTNRNALNIVLRTWVGTHCDAIADFAANATMGPDAAAANASLYGDGLHPTTTGHGHLEGVYRAAINAM